MKAIVKRVARLSLLLATGLVLMSVQGCKIATPDAKGKVEEPATLQKRLTGNHSEAVTVQLLETVIAADQTLLITDQISEHGWPLPAIETVVLYEYQLCQMSREQRSRYLEKYKAATDLPQQFETMLLASCAPDITPSALALSLKQVRAARSWPKSYLAYFDSLERHQQALVRLEKLYGNLKQQMDTTLEKLTEIEVQTQP